MNTKLNYAELKTLCSFVINRIKTKGFLNIKGTVINETASKVSTKINFFNKTFLRRPETIIDEMKAEEFYEIVKKNL